MWAKIQGGKDDLTAALGSTLEFDAIWAAFEMHIFKLP